MSLSLYIDVSHAMSIARLIIYRKCTIYVERVIEDPIFERIVKRLTKTSKASHNLKNIYEHVASLCNIFCILSCAVPARITAIHPLKSLYYISYRAFFSYVPHSVQYNLA